MHINAHRRVGPVVALVPAPLDRPDLAMLSKLREDPNTQAANSCGWDLLCPTDLEISWNGGAHSEDIIISAPDFATSRLGNGIFSLALGYLFTIESGHQLWIRGPINHAKNGIQAIEQIADPSQLPLLHTIQWRFTQPGTIHFQQNEPFCTIVPYPAEYVERFEGSITELTSESTGLLPPHDLPGVSCICTTYGRPQLLEEAIAAFLKQDYPGPKELIVLNDFTQQRLSFSHPEVKIINAVERYPTLGEKTNAAIAMAAYDLICLWDDDDISLPHRISLLVAHLDPAKGFVKSELAFFWNNGTISSIERNLFHASSCYTRTLFERVGGYPAISSGLDQALEQRFEQLQPGVTAPLDLPLNQLYYFYRWSGTGSPHISSLKQSDTPANGEYQKLAELVAAASAANQMPTGLIELQPQWRLDYIAQAQAFLEVQLNQAASQLPGVSCICLTYGRPQLLEEAIAAFLKQDYPGPKELIVLNDFERQTLVFDHPEVRIINLPRRFRTLGEKYNAAVALASYDLLCPWDDDDISLPHRLASSVAGVERKKGFFKASQAFFWNNGEISSIERNFFHGSSCYTRTLFDQVGGYPHTGSGRDIALESAFEQVTLDLTKPDELPPEQLYFIYRWGGTASYHTSAMSASDPATAIAEYVNARVAEGALTTGRIVLRPAWRADYLKLAEAYAAQPAKATETPTVAVESAAAFVPPPIVFWALPRPVTADYEAQLFQSNAPRKISVIIPAANESFYLQRTVAQFAATLPAASEIIVVDNGSTDGCADFLANGWRPTERNGEVDIQFYRSADPLGVSGARNLGISRAYGEVIVIADAHVDLPVGWWQPMVATLNRPRVGIVGPGFGILGNAEPAPACGQRIVNSLLRTEWLPYMQVDPYPVPVLGGGFMAMRRSTIAQVGAFDAGMMQWGAEDLEICLRMWLMGYEVWLTPEVTIPHYFRTSNPNKIDYYWVIHNTIRTALLHFSQERIARVLWSFASNKLYPKALAIATDSDVWQRRQQFATRRQFDDDWFFQHPYFRSIDMNV